MTEENVGDFIRLYFVDSTFIDVDVWPGLFHTLKAKFEAYVSQGIDSIIDLNYASLDGSESSVVVRMSAIHGIGYSTPQSRLSTHKREVAFNKEEESFREEAGAKPEWMD